MLLMITLLFWLLLVAVTSTICHDNQQQHLQPSSSLSSSSLSYRDGTIGCLYSDSLCLPFETCFNDNVFGRCERFDPITGVVDNDYTYYKLDRKTFQLLQRELIRLSSQGFDWSHPYSQCILKTILNDRPRITYDRTVCDSVLTDNDNDNDNEIDDNKNMLLKLLFNPTTDTTKHLTDLNKEHLPQTAFNINNNVDDGDIINDDDDNIDKLFFLFTKYKPQDQNNNNNNDNKIESIIRVPEIRVSRDASFDEDGDDDHYDNNNNNDDDDDDDDDYNQFHFQPIDDDLLIIDLDNNLDNNNLDNNNPDGNLDNTNQTDEMPNFDRQHRVDIKKPGPIFVEEYWFRSDDHDRPQNQHKQQTTTISSISSVNNNLIKKDFSVLATQPVAEGPVKMESSQSQDILLIRSLEEGERSDLEAIDSTHTYVITDKQLGQEDSARFLQTVEQLFNLPRGTFSNLRQEDRKISFKVNPNYLELNASQVASRIEDMAQLILEATGYLIEETGIGDKTNLPVLSANTIAANNRHIKLIMIIVGSLVVSVMLVAYVFYILRDYMFRERIKRLMKLSDDWIHFDYQELCRQRFKNKADVEQGNSNKQETGQQQPQQTTTSSDGCHSPSGSRSSTSSWIEEPVSSNMDITTGHIILSYMEDHLKNKSRLEHEWQALCAYETDPCATNAALQKKNLNKNRYQNVLPYDHSRVILNDSANAVNSDYINANTITDHDPRNPAYIATQGPLSNTKADFWQMIWEQGSVLIVMLTRLRENGLNMCDRYWPEEGSELFGNYELHLVSEHIWCDDYLVRSFYLKNLKTGETRTVTQFHYLSWPENAVPSNIKSLLEFRRKVNKSYKGRSCPIVVHCSDGVGRTGTYILIDMVLNRMAKGAKEIDIAASLEHVRDQRMAMVKTKAQFEFVLLAVADEVQAILKALSN